MAGLIDKENKNLSILDASNKNNHAGVERREASERAEALLGVINEYRVYAHRFESLPTWDVLEFLSKLEKELFNRFKGDVENGEIDKLRNEYFMVVGKKPFMAWNADELRKRIEDYKTEMQEKNKLDGHYLSTVKKNQWKKLKR